MKKYLFLPLLGLFVLLLFGVIAHSTEAALPPNFQVTQLIGTGLNGPSGFSRAPDGRIFILERTGAIKIYKNGQLLSTPFATLPSAASGDRGLIGLAFDPNFNQNHYVYFYYCSSGDLLNRLVRFDASGDVGTNLFVLYQTSSPSQFLHVGGSVVFGPDGKLYFAVGDNGEPPNAQDLSNPHGKILRINADGTVPNDNPFYGQPGKLGEIWAYGFRNPWRFQFDPVSGKMYGGEVGESSFEEINEIKKGKNYGWPLCEGYCTTPHPEFTEPLYAYSHGGYSSSAITGGPIYRGNQFPQEYQGNFFFGDYGQGALRRAIFDANGSISQVVDFDNAAGSVVDLHTESDGSLLYLTIFPGRLYRVQYSNGNHVPSAVATSDVTKGLSPLTVHFSGGNSTDPDGDALSYSWDFGDGTVSSEVNPVKTYAQQGTYIVELNVSDGQQTAQGVPIVIQAGLPPHVTIANPVNGSLYRAGDTISYTAGGTDGAGFDMPDSSFTTDIIFHHHNHIHPFLGPLQQKNGSFTIPQTGEVDPDVWYEIRITATDTNGLSASSSTYIYPRTAWITLDTNPTSLNVLLDGTPHQAYYVFQGVVGFKRTIAAPDQTVNGYNYTFEGWTDGGAQTHEITIPETNTTISASLKKTAAPPPPTNPCDTPGASNFTACYFGAKDLTNLKLNRTDNTINFDWGLGSPAAGVPADSFSASWIGSFAFEANNYTFTVTGDDGVKLYIDNDLVLDKFIDQPPTTYTISKPLTAGNHIIKLLYYENGGGAVAKLSWSPQAGSGPPLPPINSCTTPTTNGFTACYFTGTNFTTQKLIRADNTINFDWGGGSPDPVIPTDGFSATWLGNFNFEASDYDFTITADDGIRVYIDTVLVLDKFIDQPPTTYTIHKTVTSGTHLIKVEYYENGGGAVAKLSWIKTGVTSTPTCDTASVDVFTGCYYDNINFTNLKLIRLDPQVNFSWGLGSPDASIGGDSFSARWLGSFQFDAASYTFTATADDGLRLSIDGQVVLDKFIDQSETSYTITKVLTAGRHNILLEYYENGGDAVAKLAWHQ